MKYIQSVVILFTLFLFQNSYAQWTKGKGNGYYKLSAWSLVADKHYTSTGNTDPNATRGNLTLSTYGEYGLTDKLDAIAYIPFFTRIYQNTQVSGTTGNVIQKGEAVNTIGDMDLGIRYKLLKTNHFAVSTTLKLGLPTGKNKGGSDGSYQTGDGEFNQLISLNVGSSYKLFQLPGYTKIFTGFNNRTKGFSDEFHYGAETGIKLFNKLWLTGTLNSIKSFKNGSLTSQNSQGSIFANNIEYVSIGAGAAYYITQKIGVSVHYATATSGRIIYASPTWSGGVFLDIQ